MGGWGRGTKFNVCNYDCMYYLRGEVINGGFGLLLDGTEVSAALFTIFNIINCYG